MHGRQLNGVLSRGANGLHEDLDFPPTPRTLTRKKNVVWMRPHVSFAFARFTPCDRWNNDFEGEDAGPRRRVMSCWLPRWHHETSLVYKLHPHASSIAQQFVKANKSHQNKQLEKRRLRAASRKRVVCLSTLLEPTKRLLAFPEVSVGIEIFFQLCRTDRLSPSSASGKRNN